MKIAIFPGSFDPFTIGHESIVKRGLDLFDKIIVGIGYNTNKKGFISIENRKKLIDKVFEDYKKVEVKTYTGLTINFCKENDAYYILRGLRTSADFEYERAIGQMNHFLEDKVETIFLLTETNHTPISSTIIREVYKSGGDVSQFIPQNIDLKDFV